MVTISSFTAGAHNGLGINSIGNSRSRVYNTGRAMKFGR